MGAATGKHITEEEQRRQKESLVLETLKKFNPSLKFDYLPLKESPRTLRYRNRIQPKFQHGRFGFFARHSHDIVEIKDCLITEEPLTEKFAEVKASLLSKNSKELQRLEMYIAEDGTIRHGLITEDDDGIGFSQVNRFQNEDLLATVLDWAGPGSYRQIFDLYAGSGNFTFPLAQKYKNSLITGVELNSKLVERAKERSKEKRLQYFVSDVENYLKRAKIGHEDLVILDPPRAGSSEQIMRGPGCRSTKKRLFISAVIPFL